MTSNTPSASFQIRNRVIGPGHPTYIIAELSANHGQKIEKAIELIRKAKECGADAVKLQTYTPDTLTIRCDNEYFRIKGGTLWDGKTLYDLYAEAYTPWDWHPKLMEVAREVGIDIFSTPFDASAVDFLEKLDVPVHKIASFEMIDIPLLRKVARTGKPIIMSTGMASLEEIEEAVTTIRAEGNNKLALLKCTSSYPAKPEDMNLRTIEHLSQKFGVIAGLSDHTMGVAVPVASVALGACIIEKHFTGARADGGPDGAFSLEPHEFKQMVDEVRIVEKALGKVHYGTSAGEEKSRMFRRSLFVTKPVKKGELLTHENVRSIRPAFGLHTRHLDEVMGKRAARDIAVGTPLAWDLLE